MTTSSINLTGSGATRVSLFAEAKPVAYRRVASLSRAVLVVLMGLAVSACGPRSTSSRADERFTAVSVTNQAVSEESSLGRRWREAAETALLEAEPTVLPYAEQGALLVHEKTALGFAFEATAGQVLEINVACRPVGDTAGNGARLYVDVFRIEQGHAGKALQRLEHSSFKGAVFRLPIRVSAEHVVRIQAESFTSVVYALTLELEASLPFPVPGYDVRDVRGFFGDDRDAGARLHTGIDIFAPRFTPVVAVSRGRAVPSHDELGGNVIWLNTAGVSYYYAHLARFAVSGPTDVAPGDVLGYVGNTGNAARTPPHVHFAVYRWGHGAIDPLPRLTDHRFPWDEGVIAPIEPRDTLSKPDALHQPVPRSLGDDVLATLRAGASGRRSGQSSVSMGLAAHGYGSVGEPVQAGDLLVPVSWDPQVPAGCATQSNSRSGGIVSRLGSGAKVLVAS